VLVGAGVDVLVSLPVGTGAPLLSLLPLLSLVPVTVAPGSPVLAVPLAASLVASVPAPGSVKQPGRPSSAIVRLGPNLASRMLAPSDQTLPLP